MTEVRLGAGAAAAAVADDAIAAAAATERSTLIPNLMFK